MIRTCSDCSAAITRQSKTGRCKPCATRVSRSNPETEARRKAAHRLVCADPAYRARMKAARARVEAERRDDPQWKTYKQAAGKRLRAHYDSDPAAQAANLAKRQIVGRKLSAQRLAWCPSARLAEYARLRRKLGADEARRQVEAALTPFESQLARVASGARLVTKPVIRRADHAFTLGGVATGML